MEFVTNRGCIDGHCTHGLGEEFNGDFSLQYEDESTNDQHNREDNHWRKSRKQNRYLKAMISFSATQLLRTNCYISYNFCC